MNVNYCMNSVWLKTFEDAILNMQQENNVSGSQVIPVTLGIEHKLSDYKRHSTGQY